PPAGCSRADAAAGHMTDGAHTPLTRARPDPPANLTDQTAGPDPAAAKACQPPFTHRNAKALEQAGAHYGELIRLNGLNSVAPQPPGLRLLCSHGRQSGPGRRRSHTRA